MRIGIFCYNLQGVGPRNRAKNLIRGLGKYTNYEVEVITNSKIDFNYGNINVRLVDLRSLLTKMDEIGKTLKKTDIVHVPVNFYQALFVRSIYNGPLVLGAGIQHERLYRILTKFLIHPSYIIETHPKVEKLWKKDGFRSTFVYPSVDTEVFRPYNEDKIEEIKRELGIPLHRKVVLYVGRLEKFKGADIFYKLTKVASNMRGDLFFVVIGDGELRYLFTSGDQNMLYLGYVKNDDLPKYYNIADVTVVPSESESFSFVSLESAACGTPVITTAEGTIKNIFGKKQIYLWANRDTSSIVEKVNLLLDDKKFYRRQVKKALEFIKVEGLTLDRFVEKHVEVYKRVIKELDTVNLNVPGYLKGD